MADVKDGIYIPGKILTDGQIGSTQKIVYAAMAANMDDDGICRLSARELGRMLGVTAPTAQNARLALVKRGYIRLVPNTQCNYKILHLRKKRRNKDA